MDSYLKHYKMKLHTIAPVFVGSGESLEKKEYLLLRGEKKVVIPDFEKFYAVMQKAGLERELIRYLTSNNKNDSDLYGWLKKHKVLVNDYYKWCSYTLDCGDRLEVKEAIEIESCQKDGYGLPYVPGTTIKGMLRTILLAYEIEKAPEMFQFVKKNICRECDSNRKINGKYFLQNYTSEMENIAFHRLNRADYKGKPVRRDNAVNDVLSGLIVGDSAPLKLEDLTLCQKIDENVRGEQQIINILRESIKPERDILFDLTIDSTLCPYTIQDITSAVEKFSDLYYERYLKFYQEIDRPSPDSVWIGGGAGFFTKTVLYPLMGEEDGVLSAMKVFEKTLPKEVQRQHRHFKDRNDKVSPHMVKYTKNEGKLYQIGMCRLSVCGE